MTEINGIVGKFSISLKPGIGDCISIGVCGLSGKLVDITTNKTEIPKWLKAFSENKSAEINLGELVVIFRKIKTCVLVQILSRYSPHTRAIARFNEKQTRLIVEALRKI